MHRVGLIVPSSNTTMETEVPWLLRERQRERPEDRFAVHSARVRMQHVTPEQLRAMNAQTERATMELAICGRAWLLQLAWSPSCRRDPDTTA
jgi:maleate isomerase